MQKLKLLLASATLALGLATLAFAGPALADTGAPGTATTTFSDNWVEVGDLVDITGTVLCAEDHSGNQGVCGGSIGDPVIVGRAAIQQLRLAAVPVACGTADATWFTILTLAAPSGSGVVMLNDFDTATLAANSATGFRTLYEDDGINHAPIDFGGECADLVVLGPDADPDFSKELTSGPSDLNGVDVLGINSNPAPNDLGPDDGVIYIGLTVPQFFVYTISINNNLGIPLVVSDVVGADFDLTSHLVTDGVDVFEGNCTYVVSTTPNAGNTPKAPEFIDIQVPFDEDFCEVDVHVVTVENPGDGNELFEPTGTRLVGLTAQGSPAEIFDTYTLNDGIKVFDASNGGDKGERITGPVGSLQLTPIFPAP